MSEPLKPIERMGDSLKRLRAFSKRVRQQAGYELEMVQHGLEPSDCRPLGSVGQGVVEVRLHSEGEHRILYVARFQRAIYVLHAFVKKTQKTPRRDVALARSRYREVLRLEGLGR